MRCFVFSLSYCIVLGCASDIEDVSGTPEYPDPPLSDAVEPFEPVEPVDCGFSYRSEFGDTTHIDLGTPNRDGFKVPFIVDEVHQTLFPEPLPETVWTRSLWFSTDGLTMPGYSDDMPLFSRAQPWTEPTRCYETSDGAKYLTEAEAYGMYIDMAELTTGVPVDTRPGVRTVLGFRGAYPGTFQWNGNAPNQFNDTLVLLWSDIATGEPKVLEFPVNTDTGARYFGKDSSSSLRPNRRYTYINGWHRSYNAPQMQDWGYRVANDSNGNGHWDRDRNGWLSGGAADYERSGYAHNIHMASVNGPLGDARIENWSAGCQVIPGTKNWEAFIGHYWTESKDTTQYFLMDTRDIDHRVWKGCTPNGSHDCPYEIGPFPYRTTGDTTVDGTSVFDTYNCSDADERGHEVVYFFTIDTSGTLHVDVDSKNGSDIDIHLLDGDDPNACLTRGHTQFSYSITPGRYFIVADSWADAEDVYEGMYELNIDFVE